MGWIKGIKETGRELKRVGLILGWEIQKFNIIFKEKKKGPGWNRLKFQGVKAQRLWATRWGGTTGLIKEKGIFILALGNISKAPGRVGVFSFP